MDVLDALFISFTNSIELVNEENEESEYAVFLFANLPPKVNFVKFYPPSQKATGGRPWSFTREQSSRKNLKVVKNQSVAAEFLPLHFAAKPQNVFGLFPEYSATKNKRAIPFD